MSSTEHENKEWATELTAAYKSPNRERFLLQAKKAWSAYDAGAKEGARKSGDSRDYAIFWSTIETKLPYIFSNVPTPRTRRTGAASNPIDAKACFISEALMELQVEGQDCEYIFEEVVKSYLITGLGQLWVRYEPTISVDPTGQTEVAREAVRFDPVHYDDFLFPDVRSWSDVEWVARRIFLTGEDIKERFKVSGEQLDKMTFKTGNRDGETIGVMNLNGKDDLQTTAIWEVWCKRSRSVYFFSGDDFDVMLTTKRPLDPVRFRDFFPCPRPLLGTTGTDTLWPIPNHVYTATSEETIQSSKKTQRALVRKAMPKALLNGEFGDELKKLWNANEPIGQVLENWIQFVNKGGFEGNVAYSPVEEYIKAAQTMSQQIQEELNSYWELCGITDLMRGIADPQNAAATNQMISDHGDTRTERIVKKVAIFFKQTYGCMYDVICDVFSPQSMIRDSGGDMNDPNAQQAVMLLKNEGQRLFRVAIETGTTLASNSGTNLAKSTEMFNVLGQVLTLALQTAEKAPSYAQAMHSLIMHTVRSMSEGRKIEEELEQAFLQGLEQAKQGQEQAMQAQQAQQQQEQQMAQMQQQMQEYQMQIQSRETGVNEFEAQIKQFIAQSNAQIEQLKLQIEQATAGQKAQSDATTAQMTAQKAQTEVAKAQADMMSAQQRVEFEAAKVSRELDIKEGQVLADTQLKKQELEDKRIVNTAELLTTGEVR
jgi:hypothetical protein